MLHTEALGLLVGAIALGAVHGVEPGHGWPVAASYALDQTNEWVYGVAASLVIGVGHLVSSIAMVGAFFYAKSYFDLTQVDEPITVLGGLQIGGPVSLVAGVLLVALGIREYAHGHAHGTHDHDGGHSGAPGHARDPDAVGCSRVRSGSFPSSGNTRTPTHTTASTTPPTAVSSGSRGSRSCSGSPTRRNSRSSRCVPARTTASN